MRETLIKAKQRIVKGFCKHSFARRFDGTPCSNSDPDAASFCIIGSLIGSGVNETINFLRSLSGSDSLTSWNDAPGRTQDEVLELLDKAICLVD